MKKHIITIAGRPGSGKSATSKLIAQKLGYEHFSSGDLFRQLGKERGMDVLHANIAAEKNADIDHLVDARLREIGETKDSIVIDSRTAWHWIPTSFKVFLDLDFDVAAKRITKDMDMERRKDENIPENNHEYAVILKERFDSEARRYTALYQINPYDTSNYDLIVDTEVNSLEQVADIILRAYQRWQEESEGVDTN